MTFIFNRRDFSATGIRGAFAALAMCGYVASAQAEGHLRLHYTISMTGIPVGELDWLIDIGEEHYTTSAQGKASGVLSILVRGEGSIAAQGDVANGQLAPTRFTSDVDDEEGAASLRVTFTNGNATEVKGPRLPPAADRIPVTDADRHGVADPLSAMLLTVKSADQPLAEENCDHVLAIFDGRKRFDLALSYKRADKVRLDKGYSGPVLVCAVVLRPISGHRADSLLVKQVAGRNDMELWFVPVAGTANLAPVKVSIPTSVGTLRIQAERLEPVNSAQK